MEHVTVSRSLQENCDSYYRGDQFDWRELCAKYKAANIVAMCASVPHAKVLDVGAGEGAVSAALAMRGFGQERYCLDVSASGVESICRRNIPGLVNASRFDGYHTDFADKFFDLGIASHVLEHVEHERVFLREVGRICNFLFVEVPLEDIVRLPRDYQPSSVGHINFYNHKTIRRLLQTSGLTVLDQRLFDTPLAIHLYESGSRGAAKFAIRRLAAVAGGRVASGFFTYHTALLCACP